MGYPMTWHRLVSRNFLTGNYTEVPPTYMTTTEQFEGRLRMINGDMRRMALDATQDGGWWPGKLAEQAGVDEDQCRRVLRAFFEGEPNVPPHTVERLGNSTEGDRK